MRRMRRVTSRKGHHRARESESAVTADRIFKARGYSGLHGGVVSRDFNESRHGAKIIIALSRQFIIARATLRNDTRIIDNIIALTKSPENLYVSSGTHENSRNSGPRDTEKEREGMMDRALSLVATLDTLSLLRN